MNNSIKSYCLLLLFLLGGLNLYAQNQKQTKVRVGWYESPFCHKDADGRRSGYAYDYQLKVSAVTGWEYEYVEGTWPELLDKLSRGEIDLLSDVSPLPNRKGSMLFSKNEMAIEDYLMMIPKKNSGIRIGEPQSVAGKRIGIEKNSVQVSLLNDWMKMYGVRCEIVELDLDANGLMSQLSQGKIDGLVAPMSIDRGRFISAFTIGSANVHFAVNKAKPELKNQLDKAMGQIHTNNPAFIYQLTEEYFSNYLNNVYLSEQECQWLKQHKTIRIGYRDDYLPFCKQNPKTGEVDGLLQDFIEQSKGAFENADFKIEAVPYPSIKDAVEAVKRGEVDAAFPHGIQLTDAEREGLVIADPLYHSVEMAVMHKGDKFDPNKKQRAGLNNNNPNYISLIQSYYPHWTTVNFGNTPDCLEGIANGEADLMLLSSYRLGVLAQYVRKNKLKAVPTGRSIAYGFVTKIGETEVHNIINRLTEMMDPNLVESSIVNHSDVSVKTSTREFIEQNTLPFLTIIIAITAAILFLLYRTRKERHKALNLAKQQKEHIDEIHTLNSELEERQAQLEEITAEQESQIEEIQTLNHDLEEHQAQLEEVTAEQEAQIEEIQILNKQLDRQNAATRAISNRYILICSINLATDHFHMISCPPYLKEALGSEGVASTTLDRAWRQLVEPEYQPAMEKFHDMSQWPTYLQDCDFHNCEYRGVRYGWSRATLFANKRDQEGKVTKVVYTLELIREQKEAELALQKANESLTQLSEEQHAQIEEIQQLNMNLNTQMDIIKGTARAFLAIYHIDLSDYSYIELNALQHVKDVIVEKGNALKSFEQMLQHLVDPEYIETMRSFTDMSTLNERLKEKGWILCKYLGTTGWKEAMFIAEDRDSNGDCKSVIWAIRDIDEYRKKEIEYEKELKEATDMAEAANHAKTSFLFNMSHDIRTPMNAIIGFTNLLRKHQEEPEKREDYLDKIENASKVLLSIINNVLEMARIEKGTVAIEETPESVEQFNTLLVSIFSELMKQKGINFTHSVNVQHHNVKCDTTKLREIFYNLLSNAYKYTEPGGTVDMSLEELPSQREGYVLFRSVVSDTGIGMSEDYLPHLFEEFTRENNTTENKIEGTGLGMPIVKRLVELMDGTIEVKSKKGVGTTFVVTMPFEIVADVEEETTSDVEFNPANFEGKRILLAEDNDLNAEIAMEILGEVGFILERAENGVRAVEMVEQAEAGYYDVVLMDIQMPEMNGFEATRAIRQLSDPAKADVIIIAMTANAFEEDSRQSMESGMNGHLAKPIDVVELMTTLSSVIKQ